MATLETSLEASYDGRTDTGQTKRLIGARATALPKNCADNINVLRVKSEGCEIQFCHTQFTWQYNHQCI